MKKESMAVNVSLIDILTGLIKRSSWVDKLNDQTQNEKALAELIEDLFHGSGLRLKRQVVKGNRYNILVANSQRPEILFTAHMDTVRPSAGWSPFEPLVKKVGGRILVYGCGAVDMKGGMAAIISALIKRGAITKKPFAALFYCGEEVDFIGMKVFMRKTGMRPRQVVNVEPTGCKIIHSCRGVLTFDIKVSGKTGHGSNPGAGVNAIDALFEASRAVREFLARLDNSSVLGESTMNLAWIHGGTFNGFEVLSIPNKIPDYAAGKIEIRRASEEITGKKIQSLIKEKLESLGAKLADFSVLIDAKPMLGGLDFSKLPALVRSKPIAGMKLRGYYDTQLLSEIWGAPCLIFGPGPVEMMHKTDEYVIFEEVVETMEVIESFLD